MIAHAANKREKETKFSFSLLNLSSFLCIVRRFLSESYTDISFLPGYGLVDVRLLHAVQFRFYELEDMLRCIHWLLLLGGGFGAPHEIFCSILFPKRIQNADIYLGVCKQ